LILPLLSHLATNYTEIHTRFSETFEGLSF
jgi:hypothetical protein